MEFAEILALIKKAIFLVGGACVVILLYYRYGKTNKKITQEPAQKEEPPKDDTPVVNVRRCDVFEEDQEVDPAKGIDINPQEGRWLSQDKTPLDEFLMDEMSPERRSEMIKDLKDMGYQGSWDRNGNDTDLNADPFED